LKFLQISAILCGRDWDDPRSMTLTQKSLSDAITSPASQALTATAPDTTQFVRLILGSLDDSKAEQVVTLDLRGKTSLADMMIIASGRSSTHVGAIADHIMRMCKDHHFPIPRIEGLPHCDWVLVDANDIIIHIFRPEVRQFYNLEKMWGGDRPAELRAS
jgi:ribosome-associated protein